MCVFLFNSCIHSSIGVRDLTLHEMSCTWLNILASICWSYIECIRLSPITHNVMYNISPLCPMSCVPCVHVCADAGDYLRPHPFQPAADNLRPHRLLEILCPLVIFCLTSHAQTLTGICKARRLTHKHLHLEHTMCKDGLGALWLGGKYMYGVQ